MNKNGSHPMEDGREEERGETSARQQHQALIGAQMSPSAPAVFESWCPGKLLLLLLLTMLWDSEGTESGQR